MAGAALRVVGVRRDGADDRRRGALAQRCRPQQGAVATGVAAEEVERRQRLLGPAREDERDGDAVEPVRDVGDHAERGAVGPVAVVDEQGERAVGGEVGGQPIERVADGERVVGEGRALEAEHRRRLARRPGERVACGLASDLLEQLSDDPERELALELRATGAQRQQPGVERRRPGRLQQRRLPDAGRAIDHHQAARALRRLLHRAADGLELGVTLEQPGRPRVVLQRQGTSLPAAFSRAAALSSPGRGRPRGPPRGGRAPSPPAPGGRTRRGRSRRARAAR